MSAPSGWWQAGPGGVAGNLLASLIFAGGQMVVTAWRKVPDSADQAEQALDAAGLHVPAGTVERWLKNPETQLDLARVVPRDWLPDAHERLDRRAPHPATPGALDNAASALRSAAGNSNQWTPAQATEALTVVLIVMLSSDQACRDRLTAARTEIIAEDSRSLLETTLDSIAWLAEVAVDTQTTARKTLEEVRGLRQHLDGSGLPSLNQLQTRHLRNNRPRATQFFTGREDVIAQVAEAATNSSRVSCVALRGMGGVGKSMIAAEYCDRYDDRFDIIWWIRAGGDLRVGDATADAMRTTATSLIDDLANLGILLGATTTEDEPTTRARKALDALASSEQRWLLVYDSANHSEAISAWLPSQGNGQVIVTSRSPEITEIARTIEVACFDKLTGAELLRARCVGRNQLAAAVDQATDAQALSLYLGGHPLALAQAGAYVASSSRHRFGTYLIKLQENLAGELSRAPRPAGYPDPAHRAFLTSIAAAEDSHPLAGRLLLALAFIEPDLAFPFELLEAFADGDFLRAGPGEVEGAVSALAAYAVIAEDQGHPIVHRLVQAAALERQPGDARAAQSWLCGFLPGILEAAKDQQTLRIAHLLQPHALRMVSGPAPAVERWKVLNANAMATLLRGDPRAAVELFEQALVLVPDEHDPNNLDARKNLASSYREAGRSQDAIAIQAPLLAQYERCIGPRDPETLRARAGRRLG